MPEEIKVIDKSGKPVSVCPYCQYTEFEVSVRISGNGGYCMTFNGKSGDNTNLHECCQYKLGKRAYCANCRKYLGAYKE
jgi:hypothetical protein